MQLSMFSSEELRASLSVSPDSERDWMTRVVISCLPILQFLINTAPHGWYGRTSPAFCRAIEGGILEPSSGGWRNSGMGSPTEFLTLNTLAFHSEGVASSLSDILETGDVPRVYFLSATACRGILRRAEKRGKALPQRLLEALKAVAEADTPEGEEKTTKTL